MARRPQLPTEPFITEIAELDPSGAGLAEHQGRTLRVHGSLPGERVAARYLLGRRLRGQALAVEIIQPSPDRNQPPCPHFGICGACALQHMTADAQNRFKQDQLAARLQSQGVSPESWLPPLVDAQWNYRRKARLSVRYVPARGRVLVGFRERDGRYVTDMEVCHVLHTRVAGQLPALTEMLGDLQAKKSIPQLEISCGDDRAALILRHLEPLAAGDLQRLLTFQEQTGLQVHLQSGGPDTVAPLSGSAPELQYTLPEFGVELSFGPLDFVQVNGGLNRRMIVQALQQLDLNPEHRVLDLFCGLGNFTLPLAKSSAAVIGLEGEPALVERAGCNADANRVGNVSFRVADLYGGQVADDWPEGRFERALLDPPRPGAGPILERLAASGVSRLVYVSCNPVSLAEDCAVLEREHGYRLLSAGVLDMFPHTAHIESMAVLARGKE